MPEEHSTNFNESQDQKSLYEKYALNFEGRFV